MPGDVLVAVASAKPQMLDRELYRHVGIEPERMKLLVNKSSVHFRADFAPIAEAILVAKAPGPMAADPASTTVMGRSRLVRAPSATTAPEAASARGAFIDPIPALRAEMIVGMVFIRVMRPAAATAPAPM